MPHTLTRFGRSAVLLAAVFAVVGLSFGATAAPQVKSPMEVVQAYVDATNRGDLEAFLALYSPAIRKFKFPDTKTSEGLEHMRAVYTHSFAEKQGIRVEIVSALTVGDKVVCHDRVTGLPGGKTADELTAYQVENGLITNVVYMDRVEHEAGEE